MKKKKSIVHSTESRLDYRTTEERSHLDDRAYLRTAVSSKERHFRTRTCFLVLIWYSPTPPSDLQAA